MRQNPSFRMTALLLTMLMVGSTLAACSSADSGEAQNTAPSTTAAPVILETTAPPETEPAYHYPDVYYNGDEFAILNAKDRYSMLYQLMPAEMNGETLNDARVELNRQIEDRYGLTLKETQVAYNDLQTYAQQEVMANTPVHDIFYLSPKQIASLMNVGYLQNLLDIDKLNLENDWWDQNLIEDGTLKNKYLYYLSGSYHLQGYEGITCIFFNKKMMADLGLEEPYQLVRDGKWTQDKLYEYAAKGANLNGDASFTFSETGSSTYGIITISNMMAGFLMGCDAYYVEKAEDDTPVIAFTSEHFQNACAKIANLTSTEGVFLQQTTVKSHFMGRRALMIGTELKAAASELRDMEDEFGLLPPPKYDEAQENYVSNMFWASHMVSIPTTCKDVDRAAIVIDTLNYEAVDHLLPAYYDRVSYKGLHDEDSVDMMEIIRTTRYYNWGLAYNWLDSIEKPIHDDYIKKGNGNVASAVASAEKLVQRLIDRTMEGLQAS